MGRENNNFPNLSKNIINSSCPQKKDEYNDLIFSNIDPIDYIKEQKKKLAIEDKK